MRPCLELSGELWIQNIGDLCSRAAHCQAPVLVPAPINSTLSEADTSADDAKPSTPQAVYRTADAPAADPLAVYGTADGAEEKKTPPAGKTPAQFPPVKPAVKPRRSLGRGLMKSASDLLGLSSSKRTRRRSSARWRASAAARAPTSRATPSLHATYRYASAARRARASTSS